MAVRDTLIFSGRRWSAVEETGHAKVGHFCRIGFTAGGHGRQWNTEQPMAFWRNFSEVDLTGTTGTLSFLAGHGDPYGELDRPERTGSNARWPALKTTLAGIAQCWDPPDTTETSFISDDPERRAIARQFLLEAAHPDHGGLPDIKVIARDDALVLRSETLASFMLASASSALRRSITMRICEACGDWFELRKVTARYCSGSCQALGYQHKALFPGPEPDLITAFRKLRELPHGRRKRP